MIPSASVLSTVAVLVVMAGCLLVMGSVVARLWGNQRDRLFEKSRRDVERQFQRPHNEHDLL